MAGGDHLTSNDIVLVLAFRDAAAVAVLHYVDHVQGCLSVLASGKVAGVVTDGAVNALIGHVVDHLAGGGDVVVALVHVDVVGHAAVLLVQTIAAVIVEIIGQLHGAEAFVGLLGGHHHKIHAGILLKLRNSLGQLLLLHRGEQIRVVPDAGGIRRGIGQGDGGYRGCRRCSGDHRGLFFVFFFIVAGINQAGAGLGSVFAEKIRPDGGSLRCHRCRKQKHRGNQRQQSGQSVLHGVTPYQNWVSTLKTVLTMVAKNSRIEDTAGSSEMGEPLTTSGRSTSPVGRGVGCGEGVSAG